MFKYALKNIKHQIGDKPVSFFLTEAYMLVCILVLFFCYGVAGNFHLMTNDREAGSHEKEICFYFDTENGKVTLEDIYHFVDEMDKGQIKKVYYAYACVCKSTECFGISENGIKYDSGEGENYRKNGWFLSGRFYSEDEFNQGDKVIVIPDVERYGNMYSYDPETETAIYNGELYKVIGMMDVDVDVLLPITSYPDDSTVDFFGISFDGIITKSSYNSMLANAYHSFGDKFRASEVIFNAAEQKRFYKKMFIQELLIIIVVVINLVLMLIHMAKCSKNKNSIYFLCGMNRQKIINTMLAQWALMLVPMYVMAVFVFDVFFKERLAVIYPYIAECIDLNVYRFITCIFIALLAFMDTFAVMSQVRIKGGAYR